MKTPIAYYGGKQNMLKYILPMIPAHTTYCEPFFGGGAVFFAKPKAKNEIVNDTLDILINFYRIAQTRFEELAREVELYLYSRRQYPEALDIIKGKVEADDVKRAAAWWFYINNTINHKINGSMRTSLGNDSPTTLAKRKHALLSGEIVSRLEGVTIDCYDALRVIDMYDTPDTFFYVDPPYFNADMGHYGGYTEADFVALLDKLENIKGKFLLSSYPYDGLKRNGWNRREIIIPIAANGAVADENKKTKFKTECLTWNYNFSGEQLGLFDGAEAAA